VTVNELLTAFKAHAERYYAKDGRPTSEVKEFGYAGRVVRELYGPTPAARFDVVALEAVRDRMVGMRWSRKRVNKQVGRVKRVFRWAAIIRDRARCRFRVSRSEAVSGSRG
jgi:hypothetical protein